MGERSSNIIDGDLGETLDRLDSIITSRQKNAPETSYTSRLLTGHEDFLYKKLVEEATETVLAAKDKDHDHLRYEAADLIYHLLVLLQREGVTLAELAGELNARIK
jgi:phosphoribosyl-ATP pyrophosphohydrolase